MAGIEDRKNVVVLNGALVALALLAFAPGEARAQRFEVAVQAGPAIPTYKQSFTLSGGSPQLSLVRLARDPSIEAENGFGLGGSAALYLLGPLGIEARLDSIDVDLRSFGGAYQIQTGGGAVTVVDVGSSTTDLERIRPVSLNLRLQGGSRVSLGVSLGLSTVTSASVASTRATTAPPAIEARPSQERIWGVNGGLSLRVKIKEPVAVFGEARGFAFRKSDWTWTVDARNLPPGLSLQAANAIAAALDPPSYTPGFWTGSVGVALRF